MRARETEEFGLNILIRSRLAGDVFIGSWSSIGISSPIEGSLPRRKEPPTTLIYGQPIDSGRATLVPYLGLLPGIERPSLSSPATSYHGDPPAFGSPFKPYMSPPPVRPTGTLFYLSAAPLSDIASAESFTPSNAARRIAREGPASRASFWATEMAAHAPSARSSCTSTPAGWSRTQPMSAALWITELTARDSSSSQIRRTSKNM
ncbi:hypothetical protein B0H66DRAFT_384438 [Apodospora peruviana]|uniref:Uncharacterized protein n=1 Tax=Apodospora peruviana TaxID=516989 RepID=A0AAE0HUB3_9PEZI|nr:hypothetical protein B0H66DRAFT_384438 [Apodospora peruviana]